MLFFPSVHTRIPDLSGATNLFVNWFTISRKAVFTSWISWLLYSHFWLFTRYIFKIVTILSLLSTALIGIRLKYQRYEYFGDSSIFIILIGLCVGLFYYFCFCTIKSRSSVNQIDYISTIKMIEWRWTNENVLMYFFHKHVQHVQYMCVENVLYGIRDY